MGIEEIETAARHQQAKDAMLASLAPFDLSDAEVVALWAQFTGNGAAILEHFHNVARETVDAMIKTNIAEGRSKARVVTPAGRA